MRLLFFLALETRIKLGIEPVEPKQPISKSNDPLRGYSLLKNPPASPNAQPVSRVYKGILPVEALETRDIVLKSVWDGLSEFNCPCRG